MVYTTPQPFRQATSAPKRARGRPPKRASDCPETERLIRDAAIAVFAEKSYDAAGMREIAARAGVNVALIAHHFGSKLGLWQAVVVELGQLVQTQLFTHDEDFADPAAAEKAFRESMRRLIAFMCDHVSVPHFMMRDFSRETERANWVYEHLSKPSLANFARLVDILTRAGRMNDRAFAIQQMTVGTGIAAAIVRREQLVRVSPDLADEQMFRESLYQGLVEPLFLHG